MDNKGIMEISKFRSLKSLKIENNAGISRNAWDYLITMQNLTNLDFYHTSKLRDDQLQSLTNLTNLSVLKLGIPRKEHSYVVLGKALASLKLSVLSLDAFSSISEKVFARLPVTITSLTLRDCASVNEYFIEPLSRLQNLTHLDLTKCVQIDDDCIAMLITHKHALRHLSLRECRKVTNRSTSALSHFQCLTYLNVSHTKISNSGVKHLVTLTSLKSLILQRCSNVSDSGVHYLSGLISLTHLNLYACTNVTDKALEDLQGLTNLSYLNLSYCKNITSGGIGLLTSLVNLVELYMYSCDTSKVDDYFIRNTLKTVTKLTGLLQTKEVHIAN